ncbi:type II secretion system F family protein [Duganella aceris]|uniref:Type II secretion system F family protein n=1 Tax=Duganella aceris TaxID=2703883 RepID=A0ABX0FPX8_9BURK|nr:type II secretion system F family protein [Duganella aceris]NGZ86505.1 type II secretion system F family protein [Duganella aceris]
MNIRLILLALLLFCAVLLLVWGIYTGWNNSRGPEAERVARRLRNALGDSGSELAVSITKERVLSRDAGLQRLLLAIPGIMRLDRLLLQAGRSMSTAQLCALMLGCGLVALILFSMLHLPWSARLVLAALGTTLPLLEAMRARRKRILRIELLLPDALDMMSRAMRAGHAFPTALKMVGDEIPDPLGVEFRTVFDEVNFGVSMPDALMNLAVRVPSTDLRYFVIAVLIQRETGGNLTDLLTSISAIIRDRLKLLGQVKIMSAEGRMSAWVLGGLPFVVGGFTMMTSPGSLDILFNDPTGQKLLIGSFSLMVVGMFAIRRITHIQV